MRRPDGSLGLSLGILRKTCCVVAAIACGGCGDVVDTRLPSDYRAWAIDSSEETSIWDLRAEKGSDPVVPDGVEAVGCQANWIVATRHPIAGNFLSRKQNLGILEYWVIDTKTRHVVGPLTEAQFHAKEVQIGISSIRFDPVSSEGLCVADPR